MNKPRPMTLSDAAKSLAIGRNKLFAELRRLKIINELNIAQPAFIAQGFFYVDERQHKFGRDGGQQRYWLTIVTDAGLFFLRDIANALQGAKKLRGSDGHDRATAEKEPNTLHGAARPGLDRGVSR